MNSTRLELLQHLKDDYKFKYFLTVTFCRNSPNSDKDIERFIRIIHTNLFTRNYLKQRKLLGIAVVREQKEILSERNHYHILIEEKENVDLIDLAKAICKATTNCDSIRSIPEKDYEKILVNNDPNNKENNTTIKLAEIPTADLERTINYVLKQGYKDNYEYLHLATGKNHESYFPIITG